jgi:hypothetical protein
MLQASRESFEDNLTEHKFTDKQVKEYVEKIYNHSNSIIKNNYKVEDLIEWYYGNEIDK